MKDLAYGLKQKYDCEPQNFRCKAEGGHNATMIRKFKDFNLQTKKVKSFKEVKVKVMENDSSNISSLIYNFSDLTENEFSDSGTCKNSKTSYQHAKQINVNKVEFVSQKIKKKDKFIVEKLPKKEKVVTPREFYQYAISKPRINNMDILISNLRVEYDQNKISYNTQSDQTILSRTLQLKWLPTKYLNPITDCRFMDYVFPLNSRVYDTDCFEMSAFYGIDQIKRVIRLENYKQNGLVRLIVEDCDPIYVNEVSPSRFFGFEYFKEWLLSLGSDKAKKFKESLEEYKKRIQRISFEIAQVDSDYFSLIKPQNELNGNTKWTHGKKYIKQLSDNTKEWINSQHIISKIHETDLRSGAMTLVAIEISQKIYDLLNIHASQSSDSKGFDVLKAIQYQDLAHVYTELFSESATLWQDKSIQERILNHCIDTPDSVFEDKTKFVGNNKIFKSSVMMVFQEKYLENFKCYKKSSAVFL